MEQVIDFDEWANDEALTDAELVKAVQEIERGLMDANFRGWTL